MNGIISWCNTNQGFAIVVLTMVYVVATIFIYRANRKSVKVSERAVYSSEKSVLAMYDNIELEQYIQNQNIRLALFDKRFEVYEAIKYFLLGTMNDRKILVKAVHEFSGYTGKSVFLFDDDIVFFLTNLRTKACELLACDGKYEIACKKQDDVSDIVDKQSEIQDYLRNVYENDLKETFAKYLDFKNIGIGNRR